MGFGLLFWVSSRGRAAYRGQLSATSSTHRQSIPAETREWVLKAARTLGYQPFAPARSLRAGYSRLVLLVVQFEQVDPNVACDLHYLETGLAGHGYSLNWHVGAHVTAGLTHPSANLTPAVVISCADETAPRDRRVLAAIRSSRSFDEHANERASRRPDAGEGSIRTLACGVRRLAEQSGRLSTRGRVRSPDAT